MKFLLGLQELLFLLIRGLIWTLPLGIIAFAAQLSAQVSAGVVADSIGKYVLVVLGGNVIQFFSYPARHDEYSREPSGHQ